MPAPDGAIGSDRPPRVICAGRERRLSCVSIGRLAMPVQPGGSPFKDASCASPRGMIELSKGRPVSASPLVAVARTAEPGAGSSRPSARMIRLTTRAAQATTHSSRRGHALSKTAPASPLTPRASPAELLMRLAARLHLRRRPAAPCHPRRVCPTSYGDGLGIRSGRCLDDGRSPSGAPLGTVNASVLPWLSPAISMAAPVG